MFAVVEVVEDWGPGLETVMAVEGGELRGSGGELLVVGSVAAPRRTCGPGRVAAGAESLGVFPAVVVSVPGVFPTRVGAFGTVVGVAPDMALVLSPVV